MSCSCRDADLLQHTSCMPKVPAGAIHRLLELHALHLMRHYAFLVRQGSCSWQPRIDIDDAPGPTQKPREKADEVAIKSEAAKAPEEPAKAPVPVQAAASAATAPTAAAAPALAQPAPVAQPAPAAPPLPTAPQQQVMGSWQLQTYGICHILLSVKQS